MINVSRLPIWYGWMSGRQEDVALSSYDLSADTDMVMNSGERTAPTPNLTCNRNEAFFLSGTVVSTAVHVDLCG